MKVLKGNAKSIFVCNGASSHTDSERQSDDYYATDPIAIHELCAVEKFTSTVFEPACGAGHMVKALQENGYGVHASDLIDRGERYAVKDFFDEKSIPYDIITNPPYKYAQEFVQHALDIAENGNKVAMFLKLTFLESKSRRTLFEKYPPKKLLVFSERVQCAKNGDFETYKKGVGTAVAYAWYIWQKGFQGDTVVKWI